MVSSVGASRVMPRTTLVSIRPPSCARVSGHAVSCICHRILERMRIRAVSFHGIFAFSKRSEFFNQLEFSVPMVFQDHGHQILSQRFLEPLFPPH